MRAHSLGCRCTAVVAAASLYLSPFVALHAAEPTRHHGWRQILADGAHEAWDVTKDYSSKAWKYSKQQAVTAYKLSEDYVGPSVNKAKEVVSEAARVGWVYSSDRAEDAWAWVSERAGDATEWATDRTSDAWALTKEKTGEMYLWTKVKVSDSAPVSYVRTTLDDSWRWTKDASGKTWVWVQDHAVEVSVVAAIVAAITVCILLSEPGKPSPCSYQKMREMFVGRQPTQLDNKTFDSISRQAFDSKANGGNYRKTFTALRPIPDGYEVHHSLPQKYEATMSQAGVNIHNPFRLQGVDPQTHQAITRDWSRWDRELGRPPSAAEVMQFKQTIDARYSGKLLEVGK
jgi:hypothetical protein